jgi:hypothetical protein
MTSRLFSQPPDILILSIDGRPEQIVTWPSLTVENGFSPAFGKAASTTPPSSTAHCPYQRGVIFAHTVNSPPNGCPSSRFAEEVQAHQSQEQIPERRLPALAMSDKYEVTAS